MKVFYDYQVFSHQKYGGISRYFFELMREIRRNHLAEYRLSIRYSENYYLKELENQETKQFLKMIRSKRKGLLQNYVNQIYCAMDIKRSDFDIFHPTYYEPYFLKHLGKRKYVLTIHDMIHEKFPQYFSRLDITGEKKKILAKNAAKIIAISENTKKDIIEILGIEEKKIEVIYHGVSVLEGRNEELEQCLPARYILYVGDRTKYKNFREMAKSIQNLLKQDDGLFLICAGSNPFDAEEEALFEKCNIKHKIKHYPADNSTLASLYRNASVFVFPSLYEGFGLPILESMQLGCPAVLSDTGSFREIGGEAALYFDPHDEASIMNCVESVLYNNELRNRLISEGFKNITRFSWEDTARKTVKVYESCI